MTEAESEVVGYLDGYRRGGFEGWAWMPSRPEHRLEIEIVVNGFVIARTMASDYRADLRAAGVGDGRHAFVVPLELDTARSGPVKVLVRTVEGVLLRHGEISVGYEPPSSEEEAEVFQAFVAAVLGSPSAVASAGPIERDPTINFIIHAATRTETLATTQGAPEYSYNFVMNAFAPLLKRFGAVHLVEDPAREVDLLYKAHLSRGENCLFLSFAPPHKTVLGLLCPTIPVVAWEFPTIPSAIWDGDARHDWRRVLRQTGRAITLSKFAADAVKATMGADFPVVAIPAPVWDRHPALQALPLRPIGSTATVAINGFVFDTRDHRFELEMVTPPVPDRPAAEAIAEVALDGIVFTAMFAPQDGRKNWLDLVTAFVSAFAGTRDATLVLKMVCADIEIWWSKFYDMVSRLPAFSCRIVVLHGFLDEGQFTSLISASNWVVNASTAEGLCLPLVEFMCGGRPAIAPNHTAMTDYVDPANTLIVDSDEEYCSWSHDPRNELTTTRHRVSWSALSKAFIEGHRIASEEPLRYLRMSEAARSTMAGFCTDELVGAKLNSFLGLGRALDTEASSELMRLSAAV
jgi:glycosyltransferase involved in cell wall biosynthesis